jgi:D-sedoheptulose 7-phosphate isomerase
MTIIRPGSWINTLTRALTDTIITDDMTYDDSGVYTLDSGVESLLARMKGQMTYLIGKGGSLVIAAHMATDFSLAGFKAAALFDPIALTPHANNFGVEAMFTRQLEGLPTNMADVLIAMSCSGKRPNILDAARYANARGMTVATFSGLEQGNPLRTLGQLKFYVPIAHYGIVQLAHEAVLHAA